MILHHLSNINQLPGANCTLTYESVLFSNIMLISYINTIKTATRFYNADEDIGVMEEE